MIVLKPFGVLKLALVAAAALSLGLAAHVAWNWAGLTRWGRLGLACAAVALGLWAIDGVQRRYELRARSIRVRVLFLWWRTYQLPQQLSIATDRLGRLYLAEARTGRRILTIPREYNRQGELEKRFWHLRVFIDPVS